MKPMIVLLLSAPLVLSVASCSTVEYVEITPQCTPPSAPALPSIDMGETWELLGDAQYRKLEAYINGLWGYADEQAALLGVICGE